MYLISQVSIIDNIYNENTDTLRIARPTHPQGTIVVFRSESLSWCCRLKLFWFRMWVGWVCVLFLSCREANIPNLSLLLCLEPFQKFLVVWWCSGVVEAHFSVQLQPKPSWTKKIYWSHISLELNFLLLEIRSNFGLNNFCLIKNILGPHNFDLAHST